HDALGGGHFVMSLRGRVRGDGLQVVDVVQKHVLELPDRGLHITRHGQIEDAEGTAATLLDGGSHALPGHHGMRSRRGGQDDVAEAAPAASAVSLRTRAPTSKADWNRRCSTGPARDRDASHASRTWPWICDSPRIIESRPADTRYKCRTASRSRTR